MRSIVPFRMFRSGWITVLFCVAVGFWAGGFKLGAPMGAILIASLLLHEVGHMLAAAALGVHVYEFGLRLAGAYNRRERASRRRDEVFISMAGPLTNLLLVVPLLFIPHIGAQLALDNLALCVVNLMPIPSSDGLRIVRTVFGSKGSFRPGEPKRLGASLAPSLSETAG